jgi:hypothetical protein
VSEPRKPDYAYIAKMETELGLPHSAPAMPVLLTRDAILKSAGSLRTEEVPVPEWGGTVLVRELTGRGRDEWEASLTAMRGDRIVPDTANLRAKLVARCAVGEDGEPLFSLQDVNALGELSAAALNRVSDAASRLSGLKEEDLEEMGKASGDGRDAGSSSV